MAVSKNPNKSGGGLWADILTAQLSSKLPLFWSLHKNSIVDKFFEGWNHIRTEEDIKYSRRAEHPREMTALSVSNCGSFVFSGFSDGWLIKNSIETARLVKKFKYNDLSTSNFEKILHIFSDAKNSFVLVAKDTYIEKLDFYIGIRLMTFELNPKDFQELSYKIPNLNIGVADFEDSNQLEMESDLKKEDFEDLKSLETPSLEACKLSLDQQNHLFVIITPKHSIKIINTENMTIVRDFNLKNQKCVSCFVIAPHAKKLIVATEDSKLGVYDLFSSSLLCLFQMDGVMESMAIRESCHLLVGAYRKQKAISLWKVQNLDWKVNHTVEMKFESQLRDLEEDKRALYFKPRQEKLKKIFENQITLEEEFLSKIESTLEENKFDMETGVSYNPKMTSLPQEKWSNLRFLQKVISRNKIKEQNIASEELDDLPFFLDIADPTFKMDNDKANGGFFGQDSKNQIIRKRDDNKFLDQDNETLESLLSKIPMADSKLDASKTAGLIQTSKSLLEALKAQNSFAIDHFLRKEAMLNSENCSRLLVFFSVIFKQHLDDFDFKVTLAHIFLESGAHHLIAARTDSNSIRLLKSLQESTNENSYQIGREFFFIQSELQRVANK